MGFSLVLFVQRLSYRVTLFICVLGRVGGCVDSSRPSWRTPESSPCHSLCVSKGIVLTSLHTRLSVF